MSFNPDVHQERLRRLQDELLSRDIAHLWVEPPVGFFYLTGTRPIAMERLTGLLVPASGELRLIVPLLLRDECASIPAELFVWDDAEGPGHAAHDALEGVATLHVGGSCPMWSLKTLGDARAGIELDMDPGALAALRERKDETELRLIRSAGELTDGIVEWVGSVKLKGLTERSLSGAIRARYLELGHQPIDEALVANGANAAMAHYIGGDIALDLEQPLLLDFGGAVDGYWSDTTRIYFSDNVSKEVEEAYAIVCDAYDAAFAAVAVGVPCADVDRAARSVIEKAGYGEAFVHRTGHGLGLEIHEPPFIRSGNDRALQAGHVFSIEPGIYVPGSFGLRYENIVCLTDSGPVAVNSTPRHHSFTKTNRGL